MAISIMQTLPISQRLSKLSERQKRLFKFEWERVSTYWLKPSLVHGLTGGPSAILNMGSGRQMNQSCVDIALPRSPDRNFSSRL